jgi:hypothetical protein
MALEDAEFLACGGNGEHVDSQFGLWTRGPTRAKGYWPRVCPAADVTFRDIGGSWCGPAAGRPVRR